MTIFFPLTFRWVPAENARHAVRADAELPGKVMAKCGQQVEVATVGSDPAAPQWLWPECPPCATAVRGGNDWKIAWPSRPGR
jgi:hypothetical protein